MGASGWHYYTPYQENIEQAFQELRQSIFASGDYFQFWRMARSYRIALGGRNEAEMDEVELTRVLDESEHMQVTPPETIEEALEWSEGQGTHSILDISHLITVPKETYIKVSLPDDIYQRFLATNEPDREIIEAIVHELTIWEPITKWIEQTRERLATDAHIYPMWSREVLQFFETKRTPQEMTDALTGHPKIWTEVHRRIGFRIQNNIGSQIRYKAFPFSDETLTRFLGTTRPTKEQFEIIERDIEPYIPRDTACYSVLYEDSRPNEIVFMSRTGD